MPRPEHTPCPCCGTTGLEVAARLITEESGDARRALTWTCRACQATGPANNGTGQPQSDSDYDGTENDEGEEAAGFDVLDADTGLPRLLSRKCATCIYRPNNLMYLTEGRRDAMAEEAGETGTAIICHSTLPFSRTPPTQQAICRGYWDVPADSDKSFRIRILRSGMYGHPVLVDPPEGS